MTDDRIGEDPAGAGPGARPDRPGTTELYDLSIIVDRIEGRSVCGMRLGDRCEITGSSRLRIPEGHFCLYALAAVLPLVPAKQRLLAAGDWLAGDTEVACPDPEEQLVMRIERGTLRSYPTGDLT